MGDYYQTHGMISVEEAIDMILGHTTVLESERIDMMEASGRVLAVDVMSDIDIAPFDNTAMDGFALRSSDTKDATPEHPVSLEVLGVLAAGEVFTGSVGAGQALRIMTGAPIPDGADSVVKIESVRVEEKTEKHSAFGDVMIMKQVPEGANVRRRGEEVRAGEVILKAGTVIGSPGVGLLAATGNLKVEVIRRPRVAILSSGDELVEPSDTPGPGQIRNSNCYSLAAAVNAAGGEATIVGIVPDNLAAMRSAIKEAVAAHDMVLVSGGAAEGDFDYTNTVFRELGSVYFSKVNMRPGKAQTLGVIDGTLVFGLAGNPSAAMVGFEVLLRPALRNMQGFKSVKRPITRARLTTDAKKPDARRFYIRARMEHDLETGEYIVTPEKNQSSALLTALQNSNCLVVLPEGLVGSTKDEIVACLRLDINEGVVI